MTEQNSSQSSHRDLRFSQHPLDDHFIIRSNTDDEWIVGVENGTASLTARHVDGEYELPATAGMPRDVAAKAKERDGVRVVASAAGSEQITLG